MTKCSRTWQRRGFSSLNGCDNHLKNLSHSTLGEDVGKVSCDLFPCSAFVMSKSSQDGLKQGSLFRKIQESPEIAS